MKATKMFTKAAMVVAVALPHAGAELQRTLSQEQEQRELMHFTVEFEECLGKHLEECQAIIEQEVLDNPSIFDNRSSLNFDVMEVRSSTASQDYYLVGLRTNAEETHVDGILGDGMIFYPWDWCNEVDDCYTVGPWDCDIGTPLTVEQCCNHIKTSVPNPDVNGNSIDCYVDPPVGSASNPIDYGRVCIHVNSENIVVHPPRNE
mmetsp:Transcript_30050/g.54466  ORF Transcript_30050/g.54466 Transcript_30050/m.54466 type:complete len:204 (+) Transcript_30050:117-728(+)